MDNPANLKYSDSHEWARFEDGVITVGITAHAAEILSDLVFLDLPEVGDEVKAGEAFGEIESVKAVSDLKAPASGEVVEINDALTDELGAVASDPFGKGWMIKIKSSDDGSALLSSADYDKLVAEEA